MKNWKWLYHVYFWAALYLAWIFYFQYHSFTLARTLGTGLCYLIFIAIDFYLISQYFIPRLLLRKKYLLFGLAVTVLLLVSAALRTLVALQISRLYFSPQGTGTGVRALYLESLTNISVWVLLILAAKTLIERLHNQVYITRMERDKTRSELDFLRAQVNPHFLFNSLNTIYGYIERENRTARNILLKFSGMLRYQLYECQADSIPLEKEIEYIQNYVSLQQYRKEENLVVRLNFDEHLTDARIAPLLLLVFIENAFKYVSAPGEKENRIEISIQKTPDRRLLFSCVNSKGPSPLVAVRDRQGIGIINVRRRLDLLYPGKHELLLHESSESFGVNLKLDLI
jgi:LytS/YehU family sensor histidine kinase